MLNDSSFLQQLDPRLARPFIVGFSDSISLVFLVGAAVMAIVTHLAVLASLPG